jgi:hypothetical protein
LLIKAAVTVDLFSKLVNGNRRGALLAARSVGSFRFYCGRTRAGKSPARARLTARQQEARLPAVVSAAPGWQQIVIKSQPK